MSDSVLVAENLSHTFQTASGLIQPFQNLSFKLEKSKILAVRGESGCGKTTLLLVCGGMRAPTQGKVRLNGKDLYQLPSSARVKYRSQNLGYMFQTLELVPYLSVLENVQLARGVKDDSARHWLERLGLSNRIGTQAFCVESR